MRILTILMIRQDGNLNHPRVNGHYLALFVGLGISGSRPKVFIFFPSGITWVAAGQKKMLPLIRFAGLVPFAKSHFGEVMPSSASFDLDLLGGVRVVAFDIEPK